MSHTDGNATTTDLNAPVAIVGIGCLFPQSPDLSAYWSNILAARDCISDVPAGHSWQVDEHFSDDPTDPDKTWCTRGGFLEKVPFDPIAFGVPPNMLESIDTTQLLSLIVARETLRDAGLDPDGDTWNRDRTSCILGITGTQEMAVTLGSRLHGPTWRKAMLRCGIDASLADTVVEDIRAHFPTWTEQSFPGLLGNVVAGRIANRLDLGGTNCVVDAACASSLAAMQYAIGDLLSGRSDLVLTGGADTLNDTFMYQCFTRTPAFTKNGDARPFDQTADGILIGEGIAITALKRLADAERDGDRIYAVIRGLGSSSDGRFKSIYAPNSSGQAKALRRTYDMAGVGPESIELVEAHGTGTKAGDVAEVGGLKAVYADADRTDRWVTLGSVKSQIGHTKSTAGAAGLVKIALALHHKVLPPTAKIDQPNPKMAFEDSPFFLSPHARPWIRTQDHKRRAAVSAFGFGGSNFHAILEEHHGGAVPAAWAADSELFLFGAETADGLRDRLQALDPESEPTLAHLARLNHTQWTPGQPHVLGFVAADRDALRTRLSLALRALDGTAVPGIHYGVSTDAPTVAFLFPGQGSQYVEMGRSAAVRHPALRQALDDADEHFRVQDSGRLSSVVFPPTAWSEGERASQEDRLRQTQWAQPALGAVSCGFADVLGQFGVRPDMTAGHSYGELVALHAAGAMDRDTLWSASRLRGQRMAELPGDSGTMAAVNGPLERISEVLDTLDSGVVLANHNHPNQGVISGPTEAVRQALTALADAGLDAKRIAVSAAFHSELVAPAAEPFSADLQDLTFRAPELPCYSNVTAQPHDGDPDAIRARLTEQITAPVRFVDAIKAMANDGATVFIEVGPKAVLSGLTRAILGDEATVIATDPLRHKQDGDTQLKDAIAALAAAGVPVSLQPLLDETLPLAPRTEGSKATVWLAGANHKNPETLNPPMPKIPHTPGPVSTAPAPESSATDAGWAAIPTSGAPVGGLPSLARSDAAPTPAAPAPAPSASSGGASPEQLAALLNATRDTLSAFQQAQQQTAEVHARFLDTWAQSSQNFTRLFETHARLVELAATGQAGERALPLPLPSRPAAPTAPAVTLPTPPVPVPSPALAALTPVVPAAPTPTPDLFAPQGRDTGRVSSPAAPTTGFADELPPLLDAAMAVEQKASAHVLSPAPRATGPSRATLNDATLAAVAEKTGYPMDMLELQMDLESDLGVDSIKRVEILSAVQEAVPGLPELDNERMGALRTLDDVVAYLAEVAGSGSGPEAPVVGRPTGPSRDELTDATLASVADKTGYPRDMLELQMDLESDLGVDSIKRVEILSAVQEAVPGLPELDNERMGALRTLEDVVSYLAEVAGSPSVPEFTNPILTQPNAVDGSALEGALMDAVAAKTGYPRDMLELQMDLESDLGVDSIKRVEIMSAVQEAVPGLPELDNETLGRLRSLSEVLDYLRSLSVGFAMFGANGSGSADTSKMLVVPPAPPVIAPSPEAGLPPVTAAAELLAEPEMALRRRVVRVVSAPDATPVALEGPVLLTADVGSIAEALAEVLQARGLDVHTVDPDWTDDAAVAKAVASVPTPRTVVHLAAVGTEGTQAFARVRGAFLVAKALGEEPSLLATVSALGGRFGRDAVAIAGDPIQGALAGLPKTLSHEWGTTRLLAIDVHPSASADALADVLASDRGCIEVGLAPEPVVLRTVHAPRRPAQTAAPLTKGDLVVVSGGARGVTAAVVVALAQETQATFLLLGRSPNVDEPAWAAGVADDGLKAAYLAQADSKPTPKELDAAVRPVLRSREVRQTLQAIQAAGGQATYAAVDVTQTADVALAIEAATAQAGPVRALIHGAGVLADKRLREKTTEAFDRVFNTKVLGFDALLAATDPASLKAVVTFSSTSGRFGNIGQCDYSMANEALTYRALQLSQQGTRALSLAWGPWSGGMVDAALKRKFAAMGVLSIPLDLGARFLWDEWTAGEGDVEVVVEAPRPSTGNQTRAFGLNSDPYLGDHRINERPVVPVAVVLEWMAQTAREVYPGLHVTAVHDLAVLKGLVVENGAARTTLAWTPAATRDGSAALAFELQGGQGALGMPVVHYRAVVELAPERPETDVFPGSNGLGAQPYARPVDDAYKQHLFHGPAFQAIDRIDGISDHGIVGWIAAGEDDTLGRGGAWTTDPVTVDSTLQLLLLWVRERLGAAALPSLVKTYRQYRPFPERVACHLEVAQINDKRGRFSATLVDEDNNVVATLDAGEYTADPSLNPVFCQN